MTIPIMLEFAAILVIAHYTLKELGM